MAMMPQASPAWAFAVSLSNLTLRVLFPTNGIGGSLIVEQIMLA
jgi:hypothetical protein